MTAFGVIALLVLVGTILRGPLKGGALRCSRRLSRVLPLSRRARWMSRLGHRLDVASVRGERCRRSGSSTGPVHALIGFDAQTHPTRAACSSVASGVPPSDSRPTRNRRRAA